MRQDMRAMFVLPPKCSVQAGKRSEVDATLKRMAPIVKEREPDCTLYQASRSRENPDMLRPYEYYADEAALLAHREALRFKEMVEGTVVPLLERREREPFKLVVG
jgi:quinol monooxygenase YgiN